MSQRTFVTTAGVIFAVIAGMHALRLLLGWEAMIGEWSVPHAVSWVGVAVFGGLAWTAFRSRP